MSSQRRCERGRATSARCPVGCAHSALHAEVRGGGIHLSVSGRLRPIEAGDAQRGRFVARGAVKGGAVMGRLLSVSLVVTVLSTFGSMARAQDCALGEPPSVACSDARVISGEPGQHIVITDVSGIAGGGSLCGVPAGHTAWFELTPTVTGPITISTCHPSTSYDTVLEVFNGGDDLCNSVTSVACTNDSAGAPCNNGCNGAGSVAIVAGQAGQRIRFAVGSFDENRSGCALCLGVIVTVGAPCGEAPTNIACSLARTLPGTPGTHEALLDVAGAKTVAFEPQPICASADAGHTVWFRVTPVVSGPMSFTTCHPNTTYDTVLQAWTGPCTGSLTPIACNDDDKRNPTCDNACGTGRGSTVSLDASAGQTYFFQVGSFDNNSDGCTLCLGVALTIENVCDLDTTPPLAEIVSPVELACACAPVAVIGTATDPDGSFKSYRLETRPAGAVGWKTIGGGADSVINGVLGTWDASTSTQGYHLLRLTTENICGQSASRVSVVWLGRGFDTVRIDTPSPQSVVGGFVCFEGTVSDAVCFDMFTADVEPDVGGLTVPLTTVRNDRGRINERFASWDTLADPVVADGLYHVRVTGLDQCGQTEEQVRDLVVDNTAPTAVLSSPQPCEETGGVVTVRGTADDANLGGWTLQYTGGDETSWVTLHTGTAPVVDGVLARWDTSGLRPCGYTLRLVVTDRAAVNCNPAVNNQAEYLTSVRIGLCGDCDEDGDVDLSDFLTFQRQFTGSK